MGYYHVKNLYKKISFTGVALVLALNSFAAMTPLFLNQTVAAEADVAQTQEALPSEEQTLSTSPESITPEPSSQNTKQQAPQTQSLQSNAITPTAIAAPAVPTLNSPISGSVKNPLNITWGYNWTASPSTVPYVTIYEFRAAQSTADLATTPATRTLATGLPSFQITSEGTWYWQVRAIKSYFGVSDTAASAWSTVSQVTIDKTAPNVTITSPVHNTTVKGLVNLSAAITDANPGNTSFEVFKGINIFDTPVYTGSADGTNPAVSWDSSGADGYYTVRVRATDKAGNINIPATYSVFIVDNNAPTISITNPGVDGINQTNNFQVSVTAQDNRALNSISIKVYSNNELATPVQDCLNISPINSPTTTVNCNVHVNSLSDGKYVIVAETTDKAGSTATANRSFLIDRNTPVVSIESPANGSVFGGSTNNVSVSGTINDANITSYQYIVKSSSGEEKFNSGVQPSSGGTVTYTWSTTGLPSDTYTITLIASDVIGQQASTATAVIVDNNGPAVTISPNNADYTGSSVVPSVTATDDYEPLTYLWTASDPDYEDIISDPTIAEPTFEPAITGNYTFYLTVTDTLGNSSQKEFTFSWKPYLAPAPTTETPAQQIAELTTSTPVTTAGLTITPFNSTSPQVLGAAVPGAGDNKDTGKTKSTATTKKKEKEIAAPASDNFAWYWILLLVAILVAIYYAYRNWQLGKESK